MKRSSRRQLIISIIAVLALAVVGNQASADGQIIQVYIPSVLRSPASYAEQVVALVNQERVDRGIPRLDAHPALMAAAATHSLDMATSGVLSHTGSDGSSAADRMRRAGYEPGYWGECIAAGYATPAEVVAGWMNSPPHRSILLSRTYAHIGVGYAHSNATGPTHFWTVDVATPG